MDNSIYDIMHRYFNVLEYTGYISQEISAKVLLMCFYLKFIKEYRNSFTAEDSCWIREAINCLRDGNCFLQ